MSKEKIIVALDVESEKQAREIINELRDEVGAFKIGLQLFTATSRNFVQNLVNQGVKIFLDVKFHDIPNTVAKASVEVARLGVWMFNIHALGGSEMMKRTVADVTEICDKEGLNTPKIIGVTVLTSSNDATLQEIGVNSNATEQVLRLAKLSANCGLDGVVASPLEVESIRQHIGKKDFLIVTPGIRPILNQQVKADDQKRILSPSEAIQLGSNYLVIGRPITQAPDMREAVREILSQI